MESKAKNTFATTQGLRRALAEGELQKQNSEIIDIGEKMYWIDFTISSGRRALTIDEVLYCQPTGRTYKGNPLSECVDCDIDPAVVYRELVDMYQ